MTTIPRRLIAGTELSGVAVLYRAVDGVWRYRFRDRNMPVSPTRAHRLLQIAKKTPGARVDTADVLAEFDAAIAGGVNDKILRELARGDANDGETTA
jgi:hypothetical protein